MLKVFLVEDESIMREGLRENIPWQQYGYEYVGDASDGEVALPLIRKAKPDVLITDIKMPFMDGLELSRIVMKELPNTKIIIISGHDDFEYARQAIQIGVEQYILKPITRESLKKVLIEINEKIEAEQEKNNYLRKFQNEMREYEQLSRRNFFEKLFGGQLPISEIYSEAGKLSLDINGPCFNIVLVTVQKKKGALVTTSSELNIVEKCNEEFFQYFMRFNEYLVFRWNMNTYGILIKGEADVVQSFTERAIQNVTRIYETIDRNYDWYVAVGNYVERLSQLTECYSQVNHAFAQRFITPSKHVLTSGVLDMVETVEGDGQFEDVDASQMDPEIIKSFLTNASLEEVGEFIDGYFESVRDAIRSKLFRNYLVLNIRFATLSYVKGLGCEQDEFLKKADAVELPDLSMGIGVLREYIYKLLRCAIEIREQESNNQGHKMMQGALEYIDSHYMQDSLSLNEVASGIDVSANYFSAVFSQEMNMTFVEYVTKKRMERAMKLLKQTDLSAADIAGQVGYKDPHYFSFVFKKTQGCTPREYRNS